MSATRPRRPAQGPIPRQSTAGQPAFHGFSWLFLLSGAPALVAQVAWIRILGAGLGHDWPSLVGVLTAFFLGLAVGAWAFGGLAARARSPARGYAALEIGAGLWVALTAPWLGDLADWASRLDFPGARESEGVWRALTAGCLAVGPAATLLGGTFPAMERALAGSTARGGPVARLYALNTLGAVVGTLAAVFWAMPTLGLRGTLWAASGIHGAVGLGAWILARRLERGTPALDSAVPRGGGEAGARPIRYPVAFRAGLPAWTGFLGMALELLGIRALAQVTENTVQTYAACLAVYLASTAAGAAWFQSREGRGRAAGWPELAFWMCALGAWELLAVAASPRVITACRGAGVPGLGGELAVAALVLGPPAWVMGALFCAVLREAATSEGVGTVLGWNLVGTAWAGPLALGGLLPWAGWRGTLGVVAVGYGLLGLAGAARGMGGGARRRQVGVGSGRVPPAAWVAAVVGMLVAFLGPKAVPPLELPDGATVIRREEGRLASVAVVRTSDGHRVLRVNNHFQQGGTATAAAARRHAHLPLLLHPSPRRALFLGVGTGITLGAAGSHPGLLADGVELLPEVVRALADFEPENGAPGRREGFRVLTADARRFVRSTRERYDVVVADLFHPAEDGAGFLYTREHFAAIGACLAPGGLFCQWVPLHQLELPVFRDLVRTFQAVFPEGTLWLLRFNVDVPVVGLMAGGMAAGEPGAQALAALRERMETPPLTDALRPLALTDPVRVHGCRLADAAGLARLAEGGTVATDDRPRVLFEAAQAAYRASTRPADRLLALLEGVGTGGASVGDAWGTRLADFRRARNAHLTGLVRELDGRRREAVEAYLASAAASADYTAGYAQAVLVASAFAAEDAAWARGILERLVVARPEQRLASEMLQRLGR